MNRYRNLINSTSVATAKEKLAGEKLLSIGGALVEIRQILSSICWVAESINRLPISDPILMMNMHDTLIEVRQTLTKLGQTANDVNQAITDINQVSSVFHCILFVEGSKIGNRYSLN